MNTSTISSYVIGGVDTHKDIHVAAIVNDSNQVYQVNTSQQPAMDIRKC